MYDFAARPLLPNEGIRVASYDVRTKRRVGFTTSDGIQLLANIHYPKGKGQYGSQSHTIYPSRPTGHYTVFLYPTLEPRVRCILTGHPTNWASAGRREGQYPSIYRCIFPENKSRSLQILDMARNVLPLGVYYTRYLDVCWNTLSGMFRAAMQPYLPILRESEDQSIDNLLIIVPGCLMTTRN